jgi:hypothetical protein
MLGMVPDGFAEEHDAAGSFPGGPSATFGWTAYAPGGPAVAPLASSSEFVVEDED